MRRAIAIGLVSAQFLLFGALILLPHGLLWPLNVGVLTAGIALVLAGAILALLGARGLGSALTASPIPKENAPLVTSGVYGLVRNPIYSGLMAGGLGLALFGASVWHLLALSALVLLLSAKTRWEERMLVAEHPDFRRYGARVGRFLPGVGRLRSPA